MRIEKKVEQQFGLEKANETAEGIESYLKEKILITKSEKGNFKLRAMKLYVETEDGEIAEVLRLIDDVEENAWLYINWSILDASGTLGDALDTTDEIN